MMEPECIISNTFAFFLRIASFFGIAPLHITRVGKGWSIKVSPVISMCGFIYITLSNLAHLISMVIQYRGILEVNNLRRVTWVLTNICDEVVMSVITSAMIYGAPKQWRQLILAMQKLQKVDSDAIWKNTKPYQLMIVWVVITLAMSIANTVITYHVIPAGKKVWTHAILLTYFSHSWIIQLHTFLFSMFIIRIRCTFEAINSRLIELLQDLKDLGPKNVLLGTHSLYAANNLYRTDVTNFADIGIQPNHHKQVRAICHAYSSATQIVRLINECYGVTLMMVLSYIFFHLVLRNYYFFASLLNKVNPGSDDADPNLILRAWEGIRCLFSILTLIVTIEPCHSSHMEMLRTRHLVSQLLRFAHSAYEPLDRELFQFFNILVICQAQYKPMNIVVISRDAILTIIGNISTYITILLNLK